MSRSEDYVPKKGRRQTKPEAKQETAAKPNGPSPDNDGWLAEMNAKYCVVQDGGRIDVLMFERHVQRVGKDEHVRNPHVRELAQQALQPDCPCCRAQERHRDNSTETAW